jgi:hypothetical protein
MLLDLAKVSACLFKLFSKSWEDWVQGVYLWEEFSINIVEIRFNRMNLHFLLLLKIRNLPQPHHNRHKLKPVEDLNTAWLERQCSFYGYLRNHGVESWEKVPDLESFEVLESWKLGFERFEVARKFLQINNII